MRVLAKFIFTLLVSLISFSAFAQSHLLSDTLNITQLLKQSHDSAISNPKASLGLATKALDLAKSMGYKNGIAAGLIASGYAYFRLGDIKSALKYVLEGIDYCKKNNQAKMEANGYNRIAALYVGIGEYDKAFKCFEYELKIREAMNDSIYVADCYCNLGITLHKQDLFAGAIINYEQAINIYHALNNPQFEAYVLRAVADIYMHQKLYDSAFKYITKSFKICKSAEIYSSFGDYYNYTKKYDSALANYNVSLKMFINDSDKLDMAKILGNIGEIEMARQSYTDAEIHLKQALDLVNQVADIDEIVNRNYALAKLYDLKGDYKDASRFYVKTITAKDSFSKADMRAKLAEYGTRFQVNEVENKNKSLQEENSVQKLKLQRKNILIAFVIVVLLTFTIIGFLLIRQVKMKAKQQKAELEQKQLRAQMNPHFIFNCLNSIQHFVILNDAEKANKYLTRFASLMRQTLENSKENTIPLRKEIDYLENYLDLELMRFKNKFTTTITIDENVDTNGIKIPPMIIQPFIENAIRHGLSYLIELTGELDVKFYQKNGFLFCEIDDNGIGRMQSKILKESSTIVYESQGMELTKQRLALVSKTTGEGYSIEVIDKMGVDKKPAGTTVVIKFPTIS